MNFRFFVSCPEQLEKDLLLELEEIWPWLQGLDGRPHSENLTVLSEDRGGLELQVPLHLGLQINFHSRLAHRVLLRLQKFNCRELSQLAKIFGRLPLKDTLGAEKFALKISAAKSKINNEKRIEQAFLEHWSSQVDESALQTVFIRAFDDEFTISLDSSGEHLHFRGLEKSHGEAPLRENLAHTALRLLLQNESWSGLSDVHLMDPMAGTGTFLFDAALLGAPLPRRFAFQDWKTCPVMLKNPQRPKPHRLWKQMSGFDVNAESVSLLQDRWTNAALSTPAEFQVQDLFKSEAVPTGADRRWLVLNPPYGIRLRADFHPEDLLRQCFEVFQPEKLAVLFSKEQARHVASQLTHYRKVEVRPASSGGLAVEFQLWKRS